ncbi:MAG: DUF3991 domain-containing protein [Bacteroidales bacterium]|nr:DUF3991 domain-containing protein [Bacteroidales bacterium]
MSYKVDFKQLKSRVGIEDVAYSLGYRIDRKAGVGRYFEMVLGDSHGKSDTIVIRNVSDKSSQTFFRRNGEKGDVVTLIKENLNAFFVDGKDDWQKVAKVLARFANMPESEYKSKEEYVGKGHQPQEFDPKRYKIKQIDMDSLPAIFSQRGLSKETVRAFSPFISLVHDTKNQNFDGYNVGFPYTNSETIGIVGYELRGVGGYKSKAAGTNSSSASWVADLSKGNTQGVTAVYFCESAFDAMALYQMRNKTLDREIAFVSIGGTFSDGQIKDVLKRFPNARAFDCFDNDLPGRTNGLRLMALAENIPLKINKTDSEISVEMKGKSFTVDPTRPIYPQVSKEVSVHRKMGHLQPPRDFKDWNDCLLNKSMEVSFSPSKTERDHNLAEQRKSSLKL